MYLDVNSDAGYSWLFDNVAYPFLHCSIKGLYG